MPSDRHEQRGQFNLNWVWTESSQDPIWYLIPISSSLAWLVSTAILLRTFLQKLSERFIEVIVVVSVFAVTRAAIIATAIENDCSLLLVLLMLLLLHKHLLIVICYHQGLRLRVMGNINDYDVFPIEFLPGKETSKRNMLYDVCIEHFAICQKYGDKVLGTTFPNLVES
uniref:Uncharacterized protein n=1 Tax=Glossina pallidipes TaxID=7398 RepID=A0A1B0AH57_GLOPL